MNTYPRICSEVGLDCKTCTEGTARNLAKLCKGLKGKMIGQMFVQIHTDPACSRMHTHFVEAYVAASIERMPERKPIMSEMPRTMAAVA
jgi:hypothetical protein